MEFQPGMSYDMEVVVDQAMVNGYAKVVGDDNPLHMDAEYAAQTRFGRPIAHGGILFGLISRILGTRFPGPGTVYLSQTMNFRRPVYIGDQVTIRIDLVEVLPKQGAVLRAEVTNEDNVVVADGEAQIKLPSWCKND